MGVLGCPRAWSFSRKLEPKRQLGQIRRMVNGVKWPRILLGVQGLIITEANPSLLNREILMHSQKR
jgi:hypothetical protein